MLGFRRRSGGRRPLGAAVTAIPSAPRRADGPVPLPAAAVVPAAVVPAAVVPAAVVPPPAAPPHEPAGASRVELGFRDGTSAVLEPGSAQAQALQELADLLSGRPAPYGVKARGVPSDTD